ncbi:hypothetical protein QQF64_004906 [Cirrhinus molitorella]|uniref:Uncharacterized protein n=1 Tax=Cirrhinus molitorella TaxID=172907 RepID=A0ABR3MJP3_9TELE
MARSEWSFGSAAWLFHRAPHSWGGKALVLAVNHSYQGVRRVGALQIEEEGGSRKPTPGAKKRSKHPEEKKEERRGRIALRHSFKRRPLSIAHGSNSAVFKHAGRIDGLSIIELTLKAAFHDK